MASRRAARATTRSATVASFRVLKPPKCPAVYAATATAPSTTAATSTRGIRIRMTSIGHRLGHPRVPHPAACRRGPEAKEHVGRDGPRAVARNALAIEEGTDAVIHPESVGQRIPGDVGSKSELERACMPHIMNASEGESHDGIRNNFTLHSSTRP